MKQIYKCILLISMFIGAGQFAEASHVAGGDISYECIGPNQFRLTLKLFRDCIGVDLSGLSQTLDFNNDCGFGSFTTSVGLIDAATGAPCTTSAEPCSQEISQLCASMQDSSTCNPGGTRPGMQMYTYVGTVTLPGQCNAWTVSYSLSARNCSNDLNPPCTPPGSAATFYIEAKMYSQTAPCNNSPVFTAQPIPYVCVNQLVNYNFGVIEADGDSLVYSLANAQDGLGSNISYQAGYSPTQPLSTTGVVTVNPNTGMLTLTPNLIGQWVIVMKVDEYDHITLAHKGSTIRDIQFVVQNCSNQVPSPTDGQINMTSGNATQTGPYGITMCEGQNFCFDAIFTDPDAGDSLTVLSNVTLAMPGSTISHSGANPMTVHVCWTAPPGSALSNSSFALVIKDNACPVTGMQTYVYTVFVSASTLAGHDTTICGAMVAALHATGGTHFTWTALPGGDPIVIGVNFSDSTIANPIATPTVTTDYVVSSDLVGVCGNIDTVRVNVTNTFTHTITQSAGNLCLGQDVQFDISPSVSGTFTYSWSPTTNLNNPNIHNPIAHFPNPGTFIYHVLMTNNLGCSVDDSITVHVAANLPPDAMATAVQNMLCLGNQTQLGVTWGPGIPPVCQASPTACTGTPVTHTIGVSNGAPFQFPGPFTGASTDGRLQFIVSAAEMNASGFLGGKISAVVINVTQKNSSSAFQNFTVHMSCTDSTAFTSAYFSTSGTTQVFSGNFTTALGDNTINFTTPYEWNGGGNLFIEMCYDNPNSGGAGGNDRVQLSNTTGIFSANRSVENNLGSSGCSIAPVGSLYDMHPLVKFVTCDYPLDLSNLVVRWRNFGPAVSDTTLANPFTNDTSSTTHELVVTSTITGCVTTDTVNVNIYSPHTNCGPDITICAGNSATLTGTTAVGGTSFSWSPSTNLSSGSVLHPSLSSPPAGTTLYTLTVTDGLGCTASDDLTITVSPVLPTSFTGLDTVACSSGVPVWLHGSPSGGAFSGPSGSMTLDSLFSPNITIAGYDTIRYTVTGCYAQTQHIIHIIGLPVAYTPNGGYYCPETPPVQLVGNPTGGTFTGPGVSGSMFDPGIAGPGAHSITYTVIDPLCGVGQYIASINVKQDPHPAITSLSPAYCTDAPPMALVSNLIGSTFTMDGNAVTSINPSTLSVGTHSVTVTFVDNITAPQPPACTHDTTQTFSIVAKPILDAGSDISICAGESVHLNASGASSGSYSWTPGTGLDDANIATPIATPSASTNYVVTGTSGICSGTDNVNVTVLTVPSVLIAGLPTKGTRPLTVQFVSTVTDGAFYAWTFGDGGTSTDEHPTHIYQTGGVDTVRLTVLNYNQQCSAWDTLLIVVDDSVKIKTFNIFTPDGDGSNDNFIVKTEGLESINVDIYNRWGKKVGEYHDLNVGWDGKTPGGKIADDGVYYFIAKAKGLDGKEYDVKSDPELKGFFHLMRSK